MYSFRAGEQNSSTMLDALPCGRQPLPSIARQKVQPLKQVRMYSIPSCVAALGDRNIHCTIFRQGLGMGGGCSWLPSVDSPARIPWIVQWIQ